MSGALPSDDRTLPAPSQETGAAAAKNPPHAARTALGQMIPLAGGDPIPLLKPQLLVGRRESCDIVLRFANVSAHHCRLYVNQGYWHVKDLQSRNGTRINGVKVVERRIDPGGELMIARHRYRFEYVPIELGAVGPPAEDGAEEIFARSLLGRLGLELRPTATTPPAQHRPRLDITVEDSPEPPAES